MQIEIWFACRQCEKRQVVRTNTTDYPEYHAMAWGPGLVPTVAGPVSIPMLCLKCGHTSGVIDLGYHSP